MRSRPSVQVWIDPGRPTPGQEVEVTVGLKSRSDTPTSGIVVQLAGTQASTNERVSRNSLSLAARFPEMKLTQGEHKLLARFRLPNDAAPTYHGMSFRSTYELKVRVDIPWWPDAERNFEMVVVPAAVQAEPSNTVFRATNEGLEAELTMATTTLSPGATLEGAVSFNNVSSKRVSLTVAFVSSENNTNAGAKYEASLFEGTLKEGEPIPFRVAIPVTAPVTFDSRGFRCEWFFEVSIQRAFGRESLMRVPIQVVPTQGKVVVSRLPAIGLSRRRELWSSVAAEHKFEFDTRNDMLRAKVGEASVTVHCPPGPGPHIIVASYAYPPLRAGLSLTAKGLLSAFRSDTVDIDAEINKAFSIVGRENTVVKALLQGWAKALIGLNDVRMDDEGLSFNVRGNGTDRAALRAFVKHVAIVSQYLGEAIHRAPFPDASAPHAAAIQELAVRLSGTVYRPGVAILGAEKFGEKLRVVLPTEREQLLRIELRRPSGHELPMLADITRKSKRRDASLEALKAAGALAIERNQMTFTVAGDMSTLLPHVEAHAEAVAQLAGLLESDNDAGPYR